MANEFEEEVEKVEGLGREVLAKRAVIVGAITGALDLVAGYGWFGIDFSTNVLRWVGVVFNALTVILTIAAVRPAVTPLIDPRNEEGQKLVPVADAPLVEAPAVPEVAKAVVQTEVLPDLPPVTAGHAQNVDSPPIVPESERLPDPDAPVEPVANQDAAAQQEAAAPVATTPAPEVVVQPVTPDAPK